jgi:hypothetical protein
MADVLLRGLQAPTIEQLKAEAAARDLTPGELVSRLVDLLEILDRPGPSAEQQLLLSEARLLRGR